MKQFLPLFYLLFLPYMTFSQRLEMGVVFGFTNLPDVEMYANSYRYYQAYADLNNLYTQIMGVRWDDNNPSAGIHVKYQFNNPFFLELNSRYMWLTADVDILAYSDLLPRETRDIATFKDGLELLSLPTSLQVGVLIGERWKVTPILSTGLMMSSNLHFDLANNRLFNPFDAALVSLLTIAPRTFHTITNFGIQFGIMELSISYETSIGRIDISESQLYKSFRLIGVRVQSPIFLFDFSSQKHRKLLNRLKNLN